MIDPVVIAPNLKRRLSGVTATIARLVPLQKHQIEIVATGPGLPDNSSGSGRPDSIPHMPIWRVMLLRRRTRRVWHARRNTEMLLGLFLKYVLRKNLKLLFTSASQRRHSNYTKWLISRMDVVIATSQKSASYLERDARVVLHGINLKSFSPPTHKQELREHLGLPDAILIGCFGRIRHQKGTDAFVDAMISLCATIPDAHGIVMGRTTEKHQKFLQAQQDKVATAGLADRIRFMPEVAVDQIPAWYQALDLFVAPQRWEGFGLTPLEAMACAVPVVATDVGAFSEIVTHDGIGRLVEAGDPDAIALAIANMLENRQALADAGRAARAHVEAHFPIEGEALALIEIYKDLLERD